VTSFAAVRWWLRGFLVGAVVGLAAGLVVGGTLGRVFMRLLFLARKDTLGFETAMGAIIGDFTAGGTIFICLFGGFMGLLLGVGYVAGRALMPLRLWQRELWFGLAACGLMLGLLSRVNREDFAVLPVTLSLLLIGGSVLVTALPVPLLVERFAPDRERNPGVAARRVLGLGAIAIGVYAATGIAVAYSA
jgi:hypothetical protein